MASRIEHRPVLAAACLTTSLLLAAGCSGGGDSAAGAFDTLADGSWPTEVLSSEAGAAKKAFFA